jgi:hypothetical protein
MIMKGYRILVLFALLFAAGSLMFPLSNALAVEEGKFELKANATMHDVLAERTGKRTTLRLQSGEDIEGTVVLVGNGLVHISKLAGKDFYDAVVNIDRISAVIIKVRDH